MTGQSSRQVISFRDLRSPADVVKWTARLDGQWPERRQVARHISRRIEDLPFPAPHVVELCPGSGALAGTLLRRAPAITYTGIDSSRLLLDFARRRLAPFAGRVRLIQADLNADKWPAQLWGDIHAVVSMQSLHDLGDEARVDRIYGLAQDLLVPGGLFLNADLIVPPGRDNPTNPGRRSIPRHLELLQARGYERVACTLQVGEFGCCLAFKAVI